MRKYLKTPEEVVDALTEGKTIVDMLGFKYSLYRGVIIKKGEYSSEACSSVMIDFHPYVEESEPFKIEVGKFYKRRDGKKARCFYVNEREAYFTIDREWQLFATYLAGNHLSNNKPAEYDIIGSWEE